MQGSVFPMFTTIGKPAQELKRSSGDRKICAFIIYLFYSFPFDHVCLQSSPWSCRGISRHSSATSFHLTEWEKSCMKSVKHYCSGQRMIPHRPPTREHWWLCLLKRCCRATGAAVRSDFYVLCGRPKLFRPSVLWLKWTERQIQI